MTHPDEHTLELYVLRAADIEPRRREIEEHLTICRGCADLVVTIENFYAAFGELRSLDRPIINPLDAVARVDRSSLEPFYSSPPERRPVTPLTRVRSFARLHPIALGGGAAVFLGGIALLLSVAMPRLSEPRNPAYVLLNDGIGRYQVYDAEDNLVWEIPASSSDLKEIRRAESTLGHTLSAVADLDGDGWNEVVTAIPHLGNTGPERNVIRIYDVSKTLRSTVTLNEACAYLGKPYHAIDGITAIVIDDFNQDGTREILALGNGGRSPTVLARLNADGTVRGSYWHYGTLNGMAAADLDQDGNAEVMVWGLNDVEEGRKEYFAMIAVLNPARIIGRTESQATAGFALEPSTAEEWYIRLPRSDVARALGLKTGIVNVRPVQYEGQPALSYWEEGTDRKGRFVLEYLLNHRMEVLAVRPDDGGARFRELLVADGTVAGPLDGAYLATLKAGVTYFDGRTWIPHPTPIEPAAKIRR